MKRLFKWLKKIFFSSSEFESIPEVIDDSEKIARGIYSPINVNPKNNKLKSNAFKPPPGLDEISVNRVDHSTPKFCKMIGKKNESVSKNRIFYGLAILLAKEIKSFGADLVYTPIKSPKTDRNIFHSDIKIGYKPERGKPLPAEYQLIVNNLASTSRFFPDTNPSSEDWTDEIY